jgi:hypothetical protein
MIINKSPELFASCEKCAAATAHNPIFFAVGKNDRWRIANMTSEFFSHRLSPSIGITSTACTAQRLNREIVPSRAASAKSRCYRRKSSAVNRRAADLERFGNARGAHALRLTLTDEAATGLGGVSERPDRTRQLGATLRADMSDVLKVIGTCAIADKGGLDSRDHHAMTAMWTGKEE